MAITAAHHDCCVADPNNLSILVCNAIFGLEGLAARAGLLRGVHYGMIFDRNVAYPFLGSREPFVRRVAEHRFNLGADIEPLALNAEFRNVANGRDLFDEHAVFDFGFGASTLRADFLRDVAAHADGAAIGQGGYSHFHGERGSVGMMYGDGPIPSAMLLQRPPNVLFHGSHVSLLGDLTP